MKLVLGIVAALEMEKRWIRAPEPLVELSGVGEMKAAIAARRLVERGATALASWGVAGGLDPDLSPGVVILPDIVIGSNGQSWGVDLEWRNRLLRRVEGRVVTSVSPLYHSPSLIAASDQKRAAYDRLGAAGVDMESAAVARVAGANGIPWIAVRVVIDAGHQDLPGAISRAIGDDGRLTAVSMVGFVFRPWLWPPLIALGRAGFAAGRSMRRLWVATQPDLALS